MRDQSLEDALQSVASPVELLRDLGKGRFTRLPDEYTHWIEEQRAWRETVALADQSYHMSDLQVEGPDALDLYADHGVNDFRDFDVGQAKQLVVSNPDGYFIGDAILFRLAENEFLSVGTGPAHDWLEFRAATGDYDVTAETRGRPVATGEDPAHFRYQLQGPHARAVMAAALDEPLPDLGFFRFTDATIDGRPVTLLRHGMAGEPGFEFWGPYEHAEAVSEAVRSAGEAYDLRRLGSKSYQTANVVLGWVPLPVPAFYDGEATRPFREWLDARRGILSIGGSYDSDDIADYYVTPVELGYGPLIDFDHEFVGREPLRAEVDDPSRTKVTLVWDDADVVDAYASLFRDGDTARYMDLPVPRSSACHYDDVRADGDHVGVSKWMSYHYNERAMLSLAVLDVEYSEPGTEVTLVWGEAGGAANPVVERHSLTEIRARVAPVPYAEDQR